MKVRSASKREGPKRDPSPAFTTTASSPATIKCIAARTPSLCFLFAIVVGLTFFSAETAQAGVSCDSACLENIGAQYIAAYLKHDPKAAPISRTVRFTENNVPMKFPDASWDTVTRQVAPALTFSDPKTGGVGIFTAVMQRDVTLGYLAIRLKVKHKEITEIEHIMVTKRNVSAPPSVFADVNDLVHDPEIAAPLAPSDRLSRDEMVNLADEYFATLQENDGTIRTKFGSECNRVLNGSATRTTNCADGLSKGEHRDNSRIRDRNYVLVDEQRGLVLARVFMDHKGVLDTITLTDGKTTSSPYHEPQTWYMLEVFKIKSDGIGPIEADFMMAPYNMPTSWPNENTGK